MAIRRKALRFSALRSLIFAARKTAESHLGERCRQTLKFHDRSILRRSYKTVDQMAPGDTTVGSRPICFIDRPLEAPKNQKAATSRIEHSGDREDRVEMTRKGARNEISSCHTSNERRQETGWHLPMTGGRYPGLEDHRILFSLRRISRSTNFWTLPVGVSGSRSEK